VVCLCTSFQLSLVLIFTYYAEMARLSLPGWLIKYRDGELVLIFTYYAEMARLSLPGWLIKYRDGELVLIFTYYAEMARLSLPGWLIEYRDGELVLIFTYYAEMARLSLPGWLIKYRDGELKTQSVNSHPSQYQLESDQTQHRATTLLRQTHYHHVKMPPMIQQLNCKIIQLLLPCPPVANREPSG